MNMATNLENENIQTKEKVVIWSIMNYL